MNRTEYLTGHKVFHDRAQTACSGGTCLYFHDESDDWRHGCEMGLRAQQSEIDRLTGLLGEAREALVESRYGAFCDDESCEESGCRKVQALLAKLAGEAKR